MSIDTPFVCLYEDNNLDHRIAAWLIRLAIGADRIEMIAYDWETNPPAILHDTFNADRRAVILVDDADTYHHEIRVGRMLLSSIWCKALVIGLKDNRLRYPEVIPWDRWSQSEPLIIAERSQLWDFRGTHQTLTHLVWNYLIRSSLDNLYPRRFPFALQTRVQNGESQDIWMLQYDLDDPGHFAEVERCLPEDDFAEWDKLREHLLYTYDKVGQGKPVILDIPRYDLAAPRDIEGSRILLVPKRAIIIAGRSLSVLSLPPAFTICEAAIADALQRVPVLCVIDRGTHSGYDGLSSAVGLYTNDRAVYETYRQWVAHQFSRIRTARPDNDDLKAPFYQVTFTTSLDWFGERP